MAEHRAPPQPPNETTDWYICVPVYEDAIGSGGNYRCTEVVIAPATSEEEAANKVIHDTEEPWFAVAVIKATYVYRIPQ